MLGGGAACSARLWPAGAQGNRLFMQLVATKPQQHTTRPCVQHATRSSQRTACARTASRRCGPHVAFSIANATRALQHTWHVNDTWHTTLQHDTWRATRGATRGTQICTASPLDTPLCAPEPPLRRQGRARHCHICTETGLTPYPLAGLTTATSAPRQGKGEVTGHPLSAIRSQALQQRALEKNRQRQLLLQVARRRRTLDHSE